MKASLAASTRVLAAVGSVGVLVACGGPVVTIGKDEPASSDEPPPGMTAEDPVEPPMEEECSADGCDEVDCEGAECADDVEICATSDDCTDDSKPLCEDGSCVECAGLDCLED